MPEFRTSEPQSRLDSRYEITPSILTNYFVAFLRSMFSNKENITSGSLRKDHYVWTPPDYANEQVSTNLFINAIGVFNPETAGHVPKILVQRVNTQAGKSVLADKIQGEANLIGTVDATAIPTLGHIRRIIPVSGVHTVYVVMPDQSSAEVLGETVWNYLMDYSHIMRADLKLDRIQIGDLGPAQKMEAPFTIKDFVIPIAVTWNYQRVTLVTQESPILKAFDIKTMEN